MQTVAVAVTEGTHPFELSVACEVFGLARPELDVEWYRFAVCAARPGPLDVGPFAITVPYGLDMLDEAATVIVPSAPSGDDEHCDPVFVAALARAYARGARLVSFCTGAFALAETGASTSSAWWRACRPAGPREPARRRRNRVTRSARPADGLHGARPAGVAAGPRRRCARPAR